MSDRHDVSFLSEFAHALAATSHLNEVAKIITARGRERFGADAACTFVRRHDDRLELLADLGCTERFRSEWRTIPLGALGLAKDGASDDVFLGSAADFKVDAYGSDDLVDQSHRQVIGYAPLRAGSTLLGLFGYSFDRVPPESPDQDFARAFASIAGLALARFNVLPPASATRLTLVPAPLDR